MIGSRIALCVALAALFLCFIFFGTVGAQPQRFSKDVLSNVVLVEAEDGSAVAFGYVISDRGLIYAGEVRRRASKSNVSRGTLNDPLLFRVTPLDGGERTFSASRLETELSGALFQIQPKPPSSKFKPIKFINFDLGPLPFTKPLYVTEPIYPEPGIRADIVLRELEVLSAGKRPDLSDIPYVVVDVDLEDRHAKLMNQLVLDEKGRAIGIIAKSNERRARIRVFQEFKAEIDRAIGIIEPGWLGLILGEVSDEFIASIKAIDIPPGSLYVSQVEMESPAHKAGVRINDIITNNSETLRKGRRPGTSDLLIDLRSFGEARDKYDLDLVRPMGRDWEFKRARVVLEPYRRSFPADSWNDSRTGLIFEDLDPEDRGKSSFLGWPAYGIRVTEIESSSRFDAESRSEGFFRGLMTNDVILEVDESPIVSLQQFKALWDSVTFLSTSHHLYVRREAENGFLFVRLPAQTSSAGDSLRSPANGMRAGQSSH